MATPDSRDNEVVVADTGPGSSTPLVTATLPGRAPAVLDPAEQVTLSSNAVSSTAVTCSIELETKDYEDYAILGATKIET